MLNRSARMSAMDWRFNVARDGRILEKHTRYRSLKQLPRVWPRLSRGRPAADEVRVSYQMSTDMAGLCAKGSNRAFRLVVASEDNSIVSDRLVVGTLPGDASFSNRP